MAFTRNITNKLIRGLSYKPGILLQGVRQAGKTTLVRNLPGRGAQYVTLDDFATRSAIERNPEGFIAGLPGDVTIDEVQRIPELMLAIKSDIDADRANGKYLLTGSANLAQMKQICDVLPGRLNVEMLWPLSQGEIESVKELFVDHIFSGSMPYITSALMQADYLQRITLGGYPEQHDLPDHEARRDSFRSYVDLIISRDARDFSEITDYRGLHDLLQLLATRSAQVLNEADLARTLRFSGSAKVDRYLKILENIYLIARLPAWHRSLGIRLIKAPKILINDTGLATFLIGRDEHSIEKDSFLLGAFFENFVAMEIIKQITWSQTQPRAYHFRTSNNKEVDIVLEAHDGSVVGIEVKASASVSSDDFAGMRELARLTGSAFKFGVVLHSGSNTTPFESNMFAMPIESLWRIV